MSNTTYIKVSSDYDGQRIDNFLIASFNSLPKTLIYRWLRKGEVRVNKKRIKQTYRINSQDIIRIPPHSDSSDENAVVKVTDDHINFLESLIIFENDDYMVINKPSGVAVHGGSGVNSGLIERLRQMRPYAKKLELAHRLDKETSGCLLVAKKYSILRDFHMQLRESKMKKIYHALVHDSWEHGNISINLPLKRNLLPGGERIVQVDKEEGKTSTTKIRLLNTYNKYSLLEASPLTGRTHQIRVHLLSRNHPIVCDKKYGNDDKNKDIQNLGFKRMFLHASKLSFKNPKTQEYETHEADYDSSIKNILKKIS